MTGKGKRDWTIAYFGFEFATEAYSRLVTVAREDMVWVE